MSADQSMFDEKYLHHISSRAAQQWQLELFRIIIIHEFHEEHFLKAKICMNS